MKKIILTAACTVSALAAFGQGSIFFGNAPTGFRAPIYGPDTANPNVQVVGQGSGGNPTGSAVYTGGLLQSGYDFSLWAGPLGSTSNQLTLVTTTSFRSSTSPNSLPAGLILSFNATIAGVAPGANAGLQIRAWNTEGGTVTDWATALAHFNANDPLMAIGWSTIFDSGQLGGIDSSSVSHPTPTPTDFTSFSLVLPVTSPEPTTFALGGLGALGLLFFRRRK